MDTGTVHTSLNHKYGSFTSDQIEQAQNGLRKKIFFLLLIADPEKQEEYKDKNYDVQEAFESLMRLMDGLNSIFDYPECFVIALGMLEEARIIYSAVDGFSSRQQDSFKRYKSLLLGAGNEILKIRGGDYNA